MDTAYGILITGAAGTVTPSTAVAIPPLLLTVKNPCKDANYVSIATQALVAKEYSLGDLAPNGLQWTHDAFSVVT